MSFFSDDFFKEINHVLLIVMAWMATIGNIALIGIGFNYVEQYQLSYLECIIQQKEVGLRIFMLVLNIGLWVHVLREEWKSKRAKRKAEESKLKKRRFN